MTAPTPSTWQRRTQLALAVVALAVVPGLMASNPMAGVGPLLVLAFFYCLWRAPLRWPALGLFFVALAVDNPGERPGLGLWKTPLSQPGSLLYENLNNLTGIKPLRFSSLDIILFLLVGAILVRRAARPRSPPEGESREDQDAPFPTASGLHFVLGTVFVSLLVLWALGLSRGGDFKASLWQIRQLFWLPVLTWIFASTLRGPKDLIVLGALVVAATVLKTTEGLYFYQVICRPLNLKPAYVTTHSDSLLFVITLIIGLVGWLLTRGSYRWFLMPVIAIGALGLAINNRRLAVVSLIADLALIYIMLPRSQLKRSITRFALLSLPFLALYAAAGWRSTSAVFAPAHMLATMTSKEDRSSGTRDVENYNLVQTLKVRPILGWGFGHEYLEYSRADNISQFFALYRYIGHNSVLWLWTVGGLVGFALFWSLLVVAVYFSARAFGMARRTVDRTAALVAMAVVVAFMAQAYGDMGLQSWTGIFLLAAALASSSQLAVAVGAWPPALPRVREVPSFGWAVPRVDVRENA
jgi:hypothetical protein